MGFKSTNIRKFKQLITLYLKSLAAVVFPKHCINCKEILLANENHLCVSCIIDMPTTNYHEDRNNPIARTMCLIPKFKHGYAFLRYASRGMARNMISSLKYENNMGVGKFLARTYAHRIKKTVLEDEIDYIIPIPVHISRLRKRGYNQSQVIADQMGKVLNITVDNNNLIRTKKTNTQTKKTNLERWKNIENIYHIKNQDSFDGKNVLIIDDVVTTGATLYYALELVSKTKCKSVSFAALATRQ